MAPLARQGRLVLFRSLKQFSRDTMGSQRGPTLCYTAGGRLSKHTGATTRLGDSLSEGVYDRSSVHDPREDLRLRTIRELNNVPPRDLGAFQPLGNSMSDGCYDSTTRSARYSPFSSLTDPSDYFLQNSLAGDSNYDLPAPLRTPYTFHRPGRGFASRPRGPSMQRIVAVARTRPGVLGDSLAGGDYVSRNSLDHEDAERKP